MRFKDLLGRSKPDQVSGGRLITPPGAVPPAPRPSPADTAEARPVPAVELPVADRFAVLLAVEQGEAPPAVAPAGRALPPLTDEEIDQVALRVAARLAETPLGADLRRIVADVSERLVREEIQRIRQAAESRLP